MIIRKLFEPKASQRSLVYYNVRVPIGASGAPGTHVGKGLTVTRTDTGDYTATINNDSSGGVGAILTASIDVVRDDDAGYHARPRVISASAGTVTFTTAADAAPGTPADPPSGTALFVTMVVRNSPSDLT